MSRPEKFESLKISKPSIKTLMINKIAKEFEDMENVKCDAEYHLTLLKGYLHSYLEMDGVNRVEESDLEEKLKQVNNILKAFLEFQYND